MYIIEFLIKKFSQKKEKNSFNSRSENENSTSENKDYETCEHVFMPIDSTKEILSCTKCGIIKKRSELKNKNFFIQE